MTSVQKKLICRPWESSGLDNRSAEVRHIRLLTHHSFSQGKKWSHHSSTQASTITRYLLQNCLSSFQCFLFPCGVCLCLCTMQMEEKWDKSLISKPFKAQYYDYHKTFMTELLTQHYGRLLIKSDISVCFIDIHRASQKSSFKLSVGAMGWPMAAEWVTNDWEVFSWRLTNG